MDIKPLHRGMQSQGTARGRQLATDMARGRQLQGALKDAYVEQLSTVPEPWLERLKENNLAIVALGYGESLADTELLTGYTPERLKSDAQEYTSVLSRVSEAVEGEIAEITSSEEAGFLAQAMAERQRPELMAEKLSKQLDEENIGFLVRPMRDTTPLEFLKNEFGINDVDQAAREGEPSEGELFTQLLTELNGEGLIGPDGMVDPKSDFLVVPYKMRGDKRISPVSEASYASVNGAGMDQHLGAHYWPNRLITVDDDVVPLPNLKSGFHSVLLHETGHAIDYIAESIEELDHRKTIDGLYARDMERYKKGEKPFLTARAMDNEREYFAEAVEAYLTEEIEAEQNHYKAENNHQRLKDTNPELYAYVHRLMQM